MSNDFLDIENELSVEFSQLNKKGRKLKKKMLMR